jgi:hypothetical protein
LFFQTRRAMWKSVFAKLIGAVLVVVAPVLFGAAPHVYAQNLDRSPRAALVAGPIVGGMAANNGYYDYGPYYWAGVPVGWSSLFGPAVPVSPGCYIQRQRIWTEYGWRWRQAPICY